MKKHLPSELRALTNWIVPPDPSHNSPMNYRCLNDREVAVAAEADPLYGVHPLFTELVARLRRGQPANHRSPEHGERLEGVPTDARR